MKPTLYEHHYDTNEKKHLPLLHAEERRNRVPHTSGKNERERERERERKKLT